MRYRYGFFRAALGVAIVSAALYGAVAPALGAGASASPPAASQPAPVDLNTASAEALTAIPGIGAVMAERIVAWREQNGPFERVEDLLKVKGIGDKSLDKLRPYVKVGKSR